jgi:Ca-activated chloride channel family protein
MTFLYPHLLYALVIPVVIAIVSWIISRRRSQRWKILVDSAYQDSLVQRPSRWLRQLSLYAGLLSLFFVILALARPISGFRETATMQKGHNILIAIDCSRSMQAKDVTPTRLDLAKTAAFDLLEAMPEDNFGLIIFSGEAHLLIPLTHDHNAVRESIEQLEYGWVSLGGTDLQNVMRLALNTFKRDHADSTNALVILSDGEDTVNVNYETAQQAKKDHLIVITAGIGTEVGEMMPDPQQKDGFYRDRQGRHVITKLDSTALKALANETGGQYLQIGPGTNLTDVVKNVAKHLDQDESEGDIQRIPEDQFALFAVPALFFLFLSLILATRWRSWGTSRQVSNKLSLLLLTSLLVLSSQTQAQDKPSAQEVPNAEERALLSQSMDKELYQSLLENIPTDSDDPSGDSEKSAVVSFLKGYVQHMEKNNDAASASFSSALLSENPSLQAAAHYNIGNAVADKAFELLTPPSSTQGDPQQPQISREKIEEAKELINQAISHYDDALSTSPDLAQAESNKKKLADFLEQLQQEEQQQDQQQQQNQQDQQQDQNNQSSQQNNDKNNSSQNQKDKDQQKDNSSSSDQSQDKDKSDQNKDDKNDQNSQNQEDKKDKNSDQNKDQNKDNQKPDQKDSDSKDKDSKDNDSKDDQSKDDQSKDGKNKDQKDKQSDQSKQPSENNKDSNSQQNPQNNSPSKPNQSQDKKDSGEQPQNPMDLNANPDKEQISQQQQSSEQQNQQVQQAEIAESKEDQEKREAMQMLRERADLEKGSPIQQRAYPYVPDKDY